MQLHVTNRLPKLTTNACQLVFLCDDGKLKGQSRKIDADYAGVIKALFDTGDFTGKLASTLLVPIANGETRSRLLLVGLGNRKQADATTWQSACDAAAQALNATPSTGVVSDCCGSINIEGLAVTLMAEQLVRAIENAAYRFTLHPRTPATKSAVLEEMYLVCARGDTESVKYAASLGLSTAEGMAVAKDLGNLAPNICTPTYLAQRAQAMEQQFDNFTTEIVDEAAMQELGMGAFLSVSAGSCEPGKLIVMNYQGKKRSGSPIVLVGKGVTFDTGGISIKGGEGMDEMKFDMCGAASVFGVMHALGQQQSSVNVIGLVAAAENMPDGRASRPGDVVTSMSGQSVEILNTDAEGRLVLCDALTYAQRFNPSSVIDIATLTGACVVALGHHVSAVFGNHKATIDALHSAGDITGDPTWPMPMGAQYQAQLDSNFADMANIGGRPAGAITAACFLARFAEEFNWAHLDIAGVAWQSGKQKGATGRPVPLLMKYIEQQIKQ